MSILGRLRRRDALIAVAPEAAGEVAVDSFQYVRVGHTALTRAAGQWLTGAPAPLDFTLEVRVGGEQVDGVRALVDSPARKNSDEGGWRAAFPTSLEAVEDPAAEFVLLVGQQRVELGAPVLLDIEAAEDGGREEPESRIREAEAGLAWLRDQVARERERRRALEVELAALNAERDHALSPMVTAVEERYREVRYGLNRVRAASNETVEKLEAALESARAVAAMAAAEPAVHERPEAPAGAMPCVACEATGTCPRCSGSGRRLARACRACAGSGGCKTCGGMGFVLDA